MVYTGIMVIWLWQRNEKNIMVINGCYIRLLSWFWTKFFFIVSDTGNRGTWASSHRRPPWPLARDTCVDGWIPINTIWLITTMATFEMAQHRKIWKQRWKKTSLMVDQQPSPWFFSIKKLSTMVHNEWKNTTIINNHQHPSTIISHQ